MKFLGWRCYALALSPYCLKSVYIFIEASWIISHSVYSNIKTLKCPPISLLAKRPPFIYFLLTHTMWCCWCSAKAWARSTRRSCCIGHSVVALVFDVDVLMIFVLLLIMTCYWCLLSLPVATLSSTLLLEFSVTVDCGGATTLELFGYMSSWLSYSLSFSRECLWALSSPFATTWTAPTPPASVD